jgi:hypothetical protein
MNNLQVIYKHGKRAVSMLNSLVNRDFMESVYKVKNRFNLTDYQLYIVHNCFYNQPSTDKYYSGDSWLYHKHRKYVENFIIPMYN